MDLETRSLLQNVPFVLLALANMRNVVCCGTQCVQSGPQVHAGPHPTPALASHLPCSRECGRGAPVLCTRSKVKVACSEGSSEPRCAHSWGTGGPACSDWAQSAVWPSCSSHLALGVNQRGIPVGTEVPLHGAAEPHVRLLCAVRKDRLQGSVAEAVQS